jgi:hypothetical protein
MGNNTRQLIKGASSLRAAYDQQVRAAQTLRSEVQTYEVRALRLQRLMEWLQLEPGKVATNSIIAQTSAALQQAAVAGGLQIGSIRESVARSSERELGTIQLDATGLPVSILPLSRPSFFDSYLFLLFFFGLSLTPHQVERLIWQRLAGRHRFCRGPRGAFVGLSHIEVVL